MIRITATAFGALLLLTSAASALTITNKEDKEITIGLDAGNKEEVQKVPAGKSVKVEDFCAEDGCGVTGPWGYSVMTKPGDTLVYDEGKAWTQQGKG